ncbi:restriction endonuclease subunit S [Candidatus Gracilibacteria bacterium]|nr:restriction endonuclease subunit S [Candidatus Gracilibacteria bacterium]
MYPTKKLGEIGIFNRGITYNKGDLLESYQKGCVTLLRANNINDGLFLDDLQYLPGGFVKNDKILQKDDIIFCMSSGSKHLVGKNARVSNLDNFSFGAFCSMFRKNTDDNIDYISYYLKSDLYKNYIFNFSQGVNILNLKNSDLENCEIPLPPLPTQKLIVQKLDSAFENIDKNINLTKENLKNIEELNKSVLEKVFSEGEYEVRKMNDICEKITDGTHQTPTYFEKGVIFLSSKNVTSGFIDWNNIKYIDEKQHIEMSKRVTPKKGDILLAKNGTTGVGAIVDKDEIFDIYVSLALLRPKSFILSKYLLYFINSPTAKKQFNSRLKGVGVPNLHLKEIKEVEVPIFDIQKQKEIVSYLDEVFAKNKELKTKYELQLKELEELKQSLLKDAFEGRLVKD